MGGVGLIFSIGGTPVYSVRVFLGTFILSLIARFRPQAFQQVPDWFSSDASLWILGIAALLEIYAAKKPELSELMAAFDPGLKAVAFVVMNIVVLADGTLEVAQTAEYVTSGVPVWWVPVVVCAIGVWWAASIRRDLYLFLAEIDDDDSLGIRSLLSWFEDGWTLIAVLVLVFLPALALLTATISLVVFWIVRRVIEAQERHHMVACCQCNGSMLTSALVCPQCGAHAEKPLRVGPFGQPTTLPVVDETRHRLELIAKRRCLHCATRLPKRSIRQVCPACKAETLPTAEWAERYLKYVQGKLGRTILVCLVLGAVPVLGLVPGIIYYKMSLISNLRAYLPPAVGCLTRWVARLVILFLIAFQWVPILGALTLPAMCSLNFLLYRAAVEREVAAKFANRDSR